MLAMDTNPSWPFVVDPQLRTAMRRMATRMTTRMRAMTVFFGVEKILNVIIAPAYKHFVSTLDRRHLGFKLELTGFDGL